VKITTKGQVTIPQHIRERLGLLPNTEVEFEIRDDAVLLRKARGSRHRGHTLVARMRGRADTGLTTDEIMALTRGED
jgi:AbrB family looped-hinge helix DNA binding protein